MTFGRRETVVAASAVGIYVSQHMYRKARRAARGELTERSVVETPAAGLFFKAPNALFGLAYYAALLASTPFANAPGVRPARRGAALLAAATSGYLGYSLLFVTRMPCPFCWTGHAANVAILIALFGGD